MTLGTAFMGWSGLRVAGCLLVTMSWCMGAEPVTNSTVPRAPEVRVQAGQARTETSNAEPAEPSPLRPPLPPVPPSFWEVNAPWIAGSLFALGAIAALIYWKLNRPVPQQGELPAEHARKALGRLIGQPQTGRVLTSVSRSLQAYFIREFKLPRQAYTTAEFENALAEVPQLPRPIASAAISLLRECDARKFGPEAAASPFDAAGTALRLVNEVESAKPPPEPAKR